MEYILTPLMQTLQVQASGTQFETQSDALQNNQVCCLCKETKPVLAITEEDVCSYCRYCIKNDVYCVDCYSNRMKYDICLVCRKLFDYKRTLPKDIALKLKHPDYNYNKCTMCDIRSDNLIMYQPTTHFCTACLTFRDEKRYICIYCYETYKDKYAPCFYCLEIIYSNPEKILYKNI